MPLSTWYCRDIQDLRPRIIDMLGQSFNKDEVGFKPYAELPRGLIELLSQLGSGAFRFPWTHGDPNSPRLDVSLWDLGDDPNPFKAIIILLNIGIAETILDRLGL